ncbi:uncharacterized protein LOC141912018 [Tubulanus polymorphus]|uniref:uncharacterized protein LOC141912018 n=1 Tax=Tubulanus polymorphus TaxID=672921 RepID=UPI003DA241BB
MENESEIPDSQQTEEQQETTPEETTTETTQEVEAADEPISETGQQPEAPGEPTSEITQEQETAGEPSASETTQEPAAEPEDSQEVPEEDGNSREASQTVEEETPAESQENEQQSQDVVAGDEESESPSAARRETSAKSEKTVSIAEEEVTGQEVIADSQEVTDGGQDVTDGGQEVSRDITDGAQEVAADDEGAGSRPVTGGTQQSRQSTAKSGRTFSTRSPSSVAFTDVKDDPFRVKADPPKTFDACYLANALGNVLTEALAEVADKRPWDPVEYLAMWLYKYAETRDQKIQEAEELEERQELEREQREQQERKQQLKEELSVQREQDKQIAKQKQEEQEREQQLQEAAAGLADVTGAERAAAAAAEGGEPAPEQDDPTAVTTTQTELDWKVLHRAAADPDSDMTALLNQGYDLTTRDSNDKTVREIAIDKQIQTHVDAIDAHVCGLFEKGDMDQIQRLLLRGYAQFPELGLKYGTEGEGLNEEAFQFWKIIPDLQQKIASAHKAVLDGDLRELQQQLDRKQLAGGVDEKGLTLLHKAIINEKMELIDYLITTFPEILELTDPSKRTAMHYAYASTNDGIVELLKSNNASLTTLDLGNHEPQFYATNKELIQRSLLTVTEQTEEAAVAADGQSEEPAAMEDGNADAAADAVTDGAAADVEGQQAEEVGAGLEEVGAGQEEVGAGQEEVGAGQVDQQEEAAE